MGGMIGREYKCRLQYTHSAHLQIQVISRASDRAAAQWCYAILFFFCSNDPIRSLIIIISRLSLSIYRADESPTANNRYSIDSCANHRMNGQKVIRTPPHTCDMEKIEWWLRSKWEHKRTMQSRAHHPYKAVRRPNAIWCSSPNAHAAG